ncbi:MAG: 2,3-bisphosphoglycerate-independent phosphoglycerate mutase [Anaerolineales bacterium]|nr:2,3-bisphosphoglycerate-independent phosphoglycerate mutase [Anaerolineales bacterium]
MPIKYIKPLLRDSDSKIVLLILDGLGGLPIEPGGPTELEAAQIPNMDRLATEGVLGQTIPIRPGVTPGSGPAHLALFGYDPLVHDIGRGALESAGVGMDVRKGDVAARGNFCTLDSDGNIADRRAGRIPTEEAIPIVESLKSIQIPGVETEVRHVKEYRFAVVMRGDVLVPEIEDTDPQQTGVPPLPAKATTPKAERTASLYNQWIAQARQVLADQPIANGLTLRGFATHPGLTSYQDAYGLKAACIAVYPMYRGVSRLVGMDVIEFPGDSPQDEFAALARSWKDYDFFFVHIKKTDSKGEDGDFPGKVKVIESVDAALPALLDLKPDVLIITGDHSTPAKLRSHSWHPVPFLLWAPASVRPDTQNEFGERSCASGSLGNISALDIMPLALAHALRLNKYGA